MSLYTLPRMKHKIAGLVGFSGLMMHHEELYEKEHQKFPVLLYHGKSDPTVSCLESEKAEIALEELDFTDLDLVIEEGLGHGISLAGIEKSSKFLKRILF